MDLFGGSFSYVSGDQIVPLLKAIASNAVGYAFQIGLSAICETCMGAIETIQKKVQQINQHFGNSCQPTQGLINDALNGLGVGPAPQSNVAVNAPPVDTDDFIIASVLAPLYYKAVRERYVQDGNFSYADQLDDAVRARNS